MPEASVYEHGNPAIFEHKIRPYLAAVPFRSTVTSQLDREMASPAGNALGAQQLREGQLRRLISPAANPRHDFRALGL